MSTKLDIIIEVHYLQFNAWSINQTFLFILLFLPTIITGGKYEDFSL